MSFTLQPQIVLEDKRCYVCGRYYAVETDRPTPDGFTCPFCARGEVREANARADAAERSMRSMRGAFAVLRKKLATKLTTK